MIKENKGWISLYRKLQSSDLWLCQKFTRGQAWVDLLLLANHKDGFINVRGNIIPVKRGQVGWSELKLSERWRWSRGKTRRFVQWLETEQMIVQHKNFQSSILTIVNYKEYQANGTINRTANGQQTEQQTDSRQYTNNNDNNVNNENNIYTQKKSKKKKVTKKVFKSNWQSYLKIAKEKFGNDPKYVGKDFDLVMEEFLEGIEIKNYKYANYWLAYLKWVRNSKTRRAGNVVGKKTTVAIN